MLVPASAPADPRGRPASGEAVTASTIKLLLEPGLVAAMASTWPSESPRVSRGKFREGGHSFVSSHDVEHIKRPAVVDVC